MQNLKNIFYSFIFITLIIAFLSCGFEVDESLREKGFARVSIGRMAAPPRVSADGDGEIAEQQEGYLLDMVRLKISSEHPEYTMEEMILDISPELDENLTITQEAVIPSGLERLFEVIAFGHYKDNEDGILTFMGSEMVDVESGEAVDIEIEMRRLSTGFLYGKVEDEEGGGAISGAEIGLRDIETGYDIPVDEKTDEGGYFMIEDIPSSRDLKLIVAEPGTNRNADISFSFSSEGSKIALKEDEVIREGDLVVKLGRESDYDKWPPTITISLEANEILSGENEVLSITVTDDLSGVAELSVWLDYVMSKKLLQDEIEEGEKNSVPIDTTVLPNGLTLLWVMAEDTAGNKGTASVPVIIDN